jgi:predicted phage terminase large subunit-like protein
MKIITKDLQHAYLKLLRNHYPAYLQKTFHTLNPSGDFVDNWHLEAICEYLSAMQKGEINRLIINIPPRSLKSIAITVAWSGFLLGHNPSCKIISASYSQSISLKHAADVRNLVQSSWHRRAFPELQIMAGQNEKHKFVTTKQGFRLATSVGGTLTGEGGDVIIIDDPQNPMQAASSLFRRRANDWFDKTLSSRLNDKNKGLMLLVMQRLHPDDLSGHLLGRGGFEHLCLPAIANKQFHINIGGFNKIMQAGELLQPKREGENILEQLKLDLGGVAFAAQYLQSPINENGAMIKREWLNYVEASSNQPEMLVQSWDTAIKTGLSNDRSACVTIAICKGNYVVVDAMAVRADFPQLCKQVISQYHKFKPDVVLIEDKASGQSLIQEMRNNSALPVIAILPKGDKISRVARITPLLEAGRISFVKEIWNDELEAEMMAFPSGKHDDMVDSLSQGLNWLAQKQQFDGVQRLRVL